MFSKQLIHNARVSLAKLSRELRAIGIMREEVYRLPSCPDMQGSIHASLDHAEQHVISELIGLRVSLDQATDPGSNDEVYPLPEFNPESN